MSAIEAELVKIFKFKKSPDDFEDHQDYLSELILCVEKIKDGNVWDSMEEETYDWLTKAVDAKNKKNEIPDFPDAEPAEPEEVEAASEDEEVPLTDPQPLHRAPAQEAESDEENEPTEVDEETPEEAPEVEGEEGAEGQGEGGPDPEAVDAEAVSGGSDAEPAEGEEPVDEVPATPGKKPRKKHVKAGKYIRKVKGKPTIQPKNKPGKEPDYKKITGTKDRYGVTEGTKTSMALKMFEKGCTMRDVNIELGDNYYVILRKLAGQGHRVDKMKNGVLTLTHRDDLGRKK